jgi:hypothetical protein
MQTAAESTLYAPAYTRKYSTSAVRFCDGVYHVHYCTAVCTCYDTSSNPSTAVLQSFVKALLAPSPEGRLGSRYVTATS